MRKGYSVRTMSPDDQMREQARPVAMHEAGHYVIARALGFPTATIFVVVGPLGANGGSDIFPNTGLRTVDEVYDHLDRRVQVICAGALAEHMVEGKIDEDGVFKALSEGGTAANDWAKVRENVHTMCSIRNDPVQDLGKQLESVAVSLLNKTAVLVIAERTTIEALANHIVNAIKRPGRTQLGADRINTIPAVAQRFGT
jgi:hypothetical protein